MWGSPVAMGVVRRGIRQVGGGDGKQKRAISSRCITNLRILPTRQCVNLVGYQQVPRPRTVNHRFLPYELRYNPIVFRIASDPSGLHTSWSGAAGGGFRYRAA
jgi:hypothetical protein